MPTLHLNLNSDNEIAIRASDMVIIADSIYLFRFVNEQTKVENLIELTKTNLNNDRWDSFDLNIPGDLDLKSGKYRYYVYESDTPGRTDYENLRLLDTSKAEIDKAYPAEVTYETDGTDTVYKIPE